MLVVVLECFVVASAGERVVVKWSQQTFMALLWKLLKRSIPCPKLLGTTFNYTAFRNPAQPRNSGIKVTSGEREGAAGGVIGRLEDVEANMSNDSSNHAKRGD